MEERVCRRGEETVMGGEGRGIRILKEKGMSQGEGRRVTCRAGTAQREQGKVQDGSASTAPLESRHRALIIMQWIWGTVLRNVTLLT